MDFTVWQDHAIGPGGFHPVAFKIGTLQLLRKNLNGNRATNCRWTLRYDKIMLWVRVVRGAWICASYHPLTLKIGNCKVFFAKTLNRIELPTVDPGWSCRQGSGLLLLTADVEKIAELASLKLGSKWFSSIRYDAPDKLKMTPSPTLSENNYCYRKPGSETGKPCLGYAMLPEAWFRDLITWWFRDIKAWFRINESLVPKHESLKQMDFTAYEVMLSF